MYLKEVYDNAQYITDEEMESSQIKNIVNSAIAEINTYCGTNLPFATAENYQTTSYNAVKDSWQLRLFEPYLSFSIASNDTDTNARDFHYQRFKMALKDFLNRGLGDILTQIDNGDGTFTDTGYEGKSKRVVPINAKARSNPWRGWW